MTKPAVSVEELDMIETFIAWSAGNLRRQLAVLIIVVNTALSAVLLVVYAVSGLGILEMSAQAILNGCVLGYVLSYIVGALVSVTHHVGRRRE